MTPLTHLISSIAGALARQGTQESLCREIAAALRVSIESPDWLPPEWKTPDPASYRRRCLYEAPDGTVSIGCFVWAPGQASPIHDHLTWGVIGVAAGQLAETSYSRAPQGALIEAAQLVLDAGQTAWCGAGDGHIHKIGSVNGAAAISLHVYGGRFDKVCGTIYHGVTGPRPVRGSPPHFRSCGDEGSRNRDKRPAW